MKGREGVFLWESSGGDTPSAISRIRDNLVRDSAEFLILSDGTEIRLDRLVSRITRPCKASPQSAWRLDQKTAHSDAGSGGGGGSASCSQA